MLQIKVTTPGEMPREFDDAVDPAPIRQLLDGAEPETCVMIGTLDWHIVYKLYEDGN